jgi:hypothetical protein
MFYFEKFIINNSTLLSTYKNFFLLIHDVISLIKPPFVLQTTSVPKKLKRKIGLKYLIKIAYKNENDRFAIALKQLISNCMSFDDANFKNRLYKSIMSTFYAGKNSELFNKKLLVFRKFFKL